MANSCQLILFHVKHDFVSILNEFTFQRQILQHFAYQLCHIPTNFAKNTKVKLANVYNSAKRTINCLHCKKSYF